MLELPSAFNFDVPSNFQFFNGRYTFEVQCTPTLLECAYFLQVYVHSEDKDFASQTIKAIGRCAVQIPEVIDSCMHGLMGLLVNRSGDAVVSLSRTF